MPTGISTQEFDPIAGGVRPHHTRTLVESRPFDYNPETGVRTTFHYFDDDTFTLEKTQDAAPLCETNLILRNEDTGRWNDGHGSRVASIPIVLWTKLRKDGIIDDRDPKQTRFRAWLNDPDNRFFRTKLGRV
jgi:hypothetical protein